MKSQNKNRLCVRHTELLEPLVRKFTKPGKKLGTQPRIFKQPSFTAPQVLWMEKQPSGEGLGE